MKIIGSFDFETTQGKTISNKICVRAYLICVYYYKIYNNTTTKKHFTIHFEDMKDFLRWVLSNDCVLYVHNLKFELSFMLPYFIKYKLKYEILENTSNVFSIKLNTSFIRDSANFFPGQTLDDIGKTFIGLGKIDNNVIVPYDYKANSKDIEYCMRDCEICIKSVLKYFSLIMEVATQIIPPENHANLHKIKNKLTNSGIAYHIFKLTNTDQYPKIDYDTQAYLRSSYFGGLVNVKKGEYCNVHSYDIVNCYPSIMLQKKFPVSAPIFSDDFRFLTTHEFWAANFEIYDIKVKSSKLPTLLKKNFMSINESITQLDYLNTTLCNIDFKMFLENYTFSKINFIDGYYFTQAKNGSAIFGDYLNPFLSYMQNLKSSILTADENEKLELSNKRNILKILVNGLYGKFATRSTTDDFSHFICKNTFVVKRKIISNTYKESLDIYYLPFAIFITAYAREKMNDAVNKVGFENVINYDTDSIKTLKQLPPDFVSKSMGSWDYEFTADNMKCVSPKFYAYKINDNYTFKIKGVPKSSINKISPQFLYTNFNNGLEFAVIFKQRVVGGTLLTNSFKKV